MRGDLSLTNRLKTKIFKKRSVVTQSFTLKFKQETLKERQKQLSTFAFYDGPIDGDFGSQSKKSIRVAFGLLK